MAARDWQPDPWREDWHHRGDGNRNAWQVGSTDWWSRNTWTQQGGDNWWQQDHWRGSQWTNWRTDEHHDGGAVAHGTRGTASRRDATTNRSSAGASSSRDWVRHEHGGSWGVASGTGGTASWRAAATNPASSGASSGQGASAIQYRQRHGDYGSQRCEALMRVRNCRPQELDDFVHDEVWNSVLADSTCPQQAQAYRAHKALSADEVRAQATPLSQGQLRQFLVRPNGFTAVVAAGVDILNLRESAIEETEAEVQASMLGTQHSGLSDADGASVDECCTVQGRGSLQTTNVQTTASDLAMMALRPDSGAMAADAVATQRGMTSATQSSDAWNVAERLLWALRARDDSGTVAPQGPSAVGAWTEHGMDSDWSCYPWSWDDDLQMPFIPAQETCWGEYADHFVFP